MIDLGPSVIAVKDHARRHWLVYALVVLALASLLILKGCDSDDAAIQSHENKAQQYEDKALNSEGKADQIKTERTETERQIAAGQPKLSERKREYEKTRATEPIISSGDLNIRERDLLTKLRQIQATNNR